MNFTLTAVILQKCKLFYHSLSSAPSRPADVSPGGHQRIHHLRSPGLRQHPGEHVAWADAVHCGGAHHPSPLLQLHHRHQPSVSGDRGAA